MSNTHKIKAKINVLRVYQSFKIQIKIRFICSLGFLRNYLKFWDDREKSGTMKLILEII